MHHKLQRRKMEQERFMSLQTTQSVPPHQSSQATASFTASHRGDTSNHGEKGPSSPSDNDEAVATGPTPSAALSNNGATPELRPRQGVSSLTSLPGATTTNGPDSGLSDLRIRWALLQEQQRHQQDQQHALPSPGLVTSESLLGTSSFGAGGSSSYLMSNQESVLAQMLLRQERQHQLSLQLERLRLHQQHQQQMQMQQQNLLGFLDGHRLQQERQIAAGLDPEAVPSNIRHHLPPASEGAIGLGLLSAASLSPGFAAMPSTAQSLMALRTATMAPPSSVDAGSGGVKRAHRDISSPSPSAGQSAQANHGPDQTVTAAPEASPNQNKRARTLHVNPLAPRMPPSSSIHAQNGLAGLHNLNVAAVPPSAKSTGLGGIPAARRSEAAAVARRAVAGDGDESDDEDPSKRFRPYQSEQWTEKFSELCEFRANKGHCQVPHTYAENPPLARWVKRQRYQYKLKKENKQSTMTDERIHALEEIGFIWDSHAAAWEEKLNELKAYAEKKGNCNVPSTYPDNAQLATWVKCQRRQYKLLRDGRTSNMTIHRISSLEKMGFVWEVRKN